MAKYALVIGINYTNNEIIHRLNFAVNDAVAMKEYLLRSGYDDPVMLTESNATHAAITQHVELISKKLTWLAD